MTPQPTTPDVARHARQSPPAPLCDRCGRRPGALLTLHEAAACLGVAYNTLVNWTYNLRALPRVHVGVGARKRLVRVRHADLAVLVSEERHA